MSKPTVSQEIGAGVFAGIVDALTAHPIDQVKTQFQVSKTPNGSVVTALTEQYAKGGLPRLYRGVLAACLRPQALCMYTGNEVASREIGSIDMFTDGAGELTLLGALIAGGLTGYPEAVGVTPFEVVKVRMQSLEHVGRYGE
jgi:solute carrier family 25 2-oxodicarboxylate transporter 21